MYRREYLTYHDVIVVSTKGDRSLCSILSSGDYDGSSDRMCPPFRLDLPVDFLRSRAAGDKLICMTSPAIVGPFRNADAGFADPPFEDSDWFEVDRRRVGDSVAPLIHDGENGKLASIFLESLFAGTQFGLFSKYHTTLAYKLGIANPLTSEVRPCPCL